ncbi:hypothetical protein AALO_G00117870, partial [Alosa alosa]
HEEVVFQWRKDPVLLHRLASILPVACSSVFLPPFTASFFLSFFLSLYCFLAGRAQKKKINKCSHFLVWGDNSGVALKRAQCVCVCVRERVGRGFTSQTSLHRQPRGAQLHAYTPLSHHLTEDHIDNIPPPLPPPPQAAPHTHTLRKPHPRSLKTTDSPASASTVPKLTARSWKQS